MHRPKMNKEKYIGEIPVVSEPIGPSKFFSIFSGVSVTMVTRVEKYSSKVGQPWSSTSR